MADSSAIVHEFTAAGAWISAVGTSAPGFSGDGGAASAAQLTNPLDLSVDLSGNLYIADQTRVRKVTSNGTIQTVAGDDYLHAIGDGGSATAGELYLPAAVGLDGAGNLYVADTGTYRVRMVTAAGIITTIAGTGYQLPGGEGTLATATPLMAPMCGGLTDSATSSSPRRARTAFARSQPTGAYEPLWDRRRGTRTGPAAADANSTASPPRRLPGSRRQFVCAGYRQPPRPVGSPRWWCPPPRVMALPVPVETAARRPSRNSISPARALWIRPATFTLPTRTITEYARWIPPA